MSLIHHSETPRDSSLPLANFEESSSDPLNTFVNSSDGEATNVTDNAKPGEKSSNRRFILQRFTIYNSQSTMYIVGSNAVETLFRIIEVSIDPSLLALVLLEDQNFFFTRNDMAELIRGLNDSIEGGIHKIAQAHGLLGFIKFTGGYYLCVVTKCSQVAVLGGHFIYHVDDTKLIPLDFRYRRPEKYSDEEKLLSIFKYLDLGKTFYLSYTYDITNSLQSNLMHLRSQNVNGQRKRRPHEASSIEPNERFVWNKMLLEPALRQTEVAAHEWFQPIIHGFIDQANVSIYGRKIYITIIARRSHHFAGARFLKRGVNNRGNVANEIETEQIVSDMLRSSFHDPHYGMFSSSKFTSYLQHRGSIPLYWTQDLNKLPKPPIEVKLSDPYFESSALHFNNLYERYQLPVIVLDLIKTKEKQPRELKLNHHYIWCIKYLNQFLPPSKKILYHSFDMSRFSKKNLDVIGPIKDIANSAISKTGFFHNGKTLNETKLQKGIIRTNCIDCLDRTNAAQFIICKEALSEQLRSLGVISAHADLEYDSDLINILTEMFHDHGDTIAVQYGGSNLVNTMDSYRRINQWSSHTRDILNSIKRIYSNSFMDLIRQEAINLFLGNYIYDVQKPKLWELQNDYYLHNNTQTETLNSRFSYRRWFNPNFFSTPPNSAPQEVHGPSLRRNYQDLGDTWYNECYVPKQFQALPELFQYCMNSNIRYFPSNTSTTPKDFHYSPFKTRKRQAKNWKAANTVIAAKDTPKGTERGDDTTREEDTSRRLNVGHVKFASTNRIVVSRKDLSMYEGFNNSKRQDQIQYCDDKTTAINASDALHYSRATPEQNLKQIIVENSAAELYLKFLKIA